MVRATAPRLLGIGSTLHLACICLFLLAPAARALSAPVNLISHGSFELYLKDNGYVPKGWCRAYLAPGAQLACNDSVSVDNAPWHVMGVVDLLYLPATIACPDGSSCIDLGAYETDPPGGMNATLRLTPGASYQISFQLGGEVPSCQPICKAGYSTLRNVTVSLHDALAPPTQAPFYTALHTLDLRNGTCRYVLQTADFTVPPAAAGPVTVAIRSVDVMNNCGALIDAVSVVWLPCLTDAPPVRPSLHPHRAFLNDLFFSVCAICVCRRALQISRLSPDQVTDPNYAVTCADGWIVTPPPSPAPLTATAPIVIDVRRGST